MSGKTKLQVVVVMLDPATVRDLDRISDEKLTSRSAVVREMVERAAAAWRKRRTKT